MSDNRRVKMTKALLREALLELLETKSIDRIKVTDVCLAADVNRSTFYLHYASIYDLLHEIEEEILSHLPLPPIVSCDTTEKQFLTPMVDVLTYAKNHARLFRVMLVERDGGALFNRAVRLMMSSMDVSGTSHDEILLRYDCAYRLNGAIGIVREWIHDDFPLTPEELAKIIWRERLSFISGSDLPH